MLERFELLRSNRGERHHLRIDPGFFINCPPVRSTKLKHYTFGGRHVDGFAETMIDGAHYPMAGGAHAVANRQQLRFAINVQGDMLHSAWLFYGGLAGLGLTVLGSWTLHEGERAGIAKTD